MPETDSVLAECIDLNSTLKKHMTLTIEKSVLGKPVTRIGGYFTDPYYMDAKIGYLFDKIYIPDSVKIITGSAFSECTNVKSIYIPDSVEKIGDKAFEECTNLQSVRLPNDLDKIEFGCFYNCKNLRKIVIPNGVQKIESNAFVGCEKLEIYIPASVKKIGKYITLTDVKKIYCQKNTVAQKYAKKNKVAVEITGTKRTQQNYVAQKLLLKKNAVTLKPDSSYRVEAEMVPFYASKQELAYSSNKPEIAAVSDEGFVTAKKAGSAVITVKTTDGSKKKVKLKVTVRPGKPVNFIVQKNTVAQKYAKKNKVAVEITGTKRTQQNYVAQKLLLKKNAVTLKPDSSYRVEAEMVPFYASKQELAYSSNKPEIAAVSDEGFVTAKKAGSAVITVKTTDGSKKKVKLKVTVRPGKPVNFIVQKKGKKKAVFSWDPVAGAAGYEVAQADSQKGKYTTIWQQKKKTSVELKISKDKYYKVRAWYKKDGELIYGAFSKAIKAS